MPACKACGHWFVKIKPHEELCDKCECALCRLSSYVAPVVRCKDCKHFKHYGKTSLLIDGEHIKAGWCYRRARYNEEYRMPPDGFCSYGERKDDADV